MVDSHRPDQDISNESIKIRRKKNQSKLMINYNFKYNPNFKSAISRFKQKNCQNFTSPSIILSEI